LTVVERSLILVFWAFIICNHIVVATTLYNNIKGDNRAIRFSVLNMISIRYGNIFNARHCFSLKVFVPNIAIYLTHHLGGCLGVVDVGLSAVGGRGCSLLGVGGVSRWLEGNNLEFISSEVDGGEVGSVGPDVGVVSLSGGALFCQS
jgi:hypothetical protein